MQAANRLSVYVGIYIALIKVRPSAAPGVGAVWYRGPECLEIKAAFLTFHEKTAATKILQSAKTGNQNHQLVLQLVMLAAADDATGLKGSYEMG